MTPRRAFRRDNKGSRYTPVQLQSGRDRSFLFSRGARFSSKRGCVRLCVRIAASPRARARTLRSRNARARPFSHAYTRARGFPPRGRRNELSRA